MKDIVLVNYGLSSVYPEIIELNYKIEDPLKSKILAHENRHDEGTKYTYQDFKNDFASKNAYFLESLKFSIRNPESFVNFFILMYSYYFRILTWNTGAIFPMLQFGLIFSLFFKVVIGMPFKVSVPLFIIEYLLMNLLFMLITHRYVLKNPMNYQIVRQYSV